MKKSAFLLLLNPASNAVKIATETENFGNIFGGLANMAGAMVGGDVGAQIGGIGGAVGNTASAI